MVVEGGGGGVKVTKTIFRISVFNQKFNQIFIQKPNFIKREETNLLFTLAADVMCLEKSPAYRSDR